MDVSIAPALEGDLEPIKRLLTDSRLPTAGIDDHWKTFLVARDGERIIGCGGAEPHRLAALIRSIAVAPEYRSHGVGRQVVRQLLDRLSSSGIREFYLLTTSAEEYFTKRGFKKCERTDIPQALLASREFQEGCCSSAVCMRLVMQR